MRDECKNEAAQGTKLTIKDPRSGKNYYIRVCPCYARRATKAGPTPGCLGALEYGEEHASEDIANEAAARKGKDPCHGHVLCYAPAD